MKNKGWTLVELLFCFWFVLIVVGGLGWCFNIGKLTQCDFAAPYKAEIIRGIGVPVPFVGAVVGYMDLGK